MGKKIIRKNIDLPETVVDKLIVLGEKDNRTVKNYMEKVLMDHAEPVIDKKKKGNK